ncbi:MAG: hypothetical protein ACI4WY_11545 [Anaerovoracaceae bacterium]
MRWHRISAHREKAGQESAPFYKEYNGTPITEGRDSDWTVVKGEAFDAWAAATAFVEITAGDRVLRLEYDCQHTHVWAEDFTVEKEATTTETSLKYKPCTDENCVAKGEITVIPKVTTGGGYYPTTPGTEAGNHYRCRCQGSTEQRWHQGHDYSCGRL